MPVTWIPNVTTLEPAKRPGALLDVTVLLTRLTDAYGRSAVADLLGTDKSAVRHWLAGKREISPTIRARILEVHNVLARAHQFFPPALVGRWLLGHEPLLGGARPIDVLGLRGATPVVDALDAIAAGAIA